MNNKLNLKKSEESSYSNNLKQRTRFLRSKKTALNHQLPLKAKVVMLGNMGILFFY
jgi:hypothetical protein